MKYEFLEHTADIKVKVYGKNLNEIFENSAIAISEFLSRGNKVNKTKKKIFKLEGENHEELLYKFIEELIYLLDAEGFLVSKSLVILETNSLTAEVFGDESKNYDYDQIKSATYHDMYVKENSKGNWEAQFIVDV